MAQQKQQVIDLTHGEKLKILIGRDGRHLFQIANSWGITTRQLNRYMLEVFLKPNIIKRACEVLGVSEATFDPRLNMGYLIEELERQSEMIEGFKHRIAILEAEKSGLGDVIKTLSHNQPKEAGN